MTIEIISLNEEYHRELPPAEGAISEFLRPEGNRLVVAVYNITKNEAWVLKKGKVRCGVLAKNGAIAILWQFFDKKGQAIFTFDCPFDARLIDDIQFHNVENAEARLRIDIHIVDLTTKIVRGLRSITMPPALTLEFLSEVQNQLADHRSGEGQYQEWLNTDIQNLPKNTNMWLLGL